MRFWITGYLVFPCPSSGIFFFGVTFRNNVDSFVSGKGVVNH